MLPQRRSLEIFGLITGHYFCDYGNGLYGCEPCFSVQSESFSGYWFDNGHCALWLPEVSDGSKSRDARPSGLGQEIRFPSENSLANGLHAKRLCVLGASLLVIGVGFVSSYKPQVQQTNLQDRIDIIQMDNELEREQKLDQVLDTITPEDKKSE